MTVRVLLADDHPVVREGLRALIATTGDLEVVAEADDGREAIRLARQHAPDAVVMDLSMPRLDGAAAAREILTARPGTGIVFLTMHTDDEALAAALQTGATGFVAKDSLGPDVLDAIRAVAAGKAYFAAAVAARVLHLAAAGVRGNATEALPELTAREREILQPRRPWTGQPRHRPQARAQPADRTQPPHQHPGQTRRHRPPGRRRSRPPSGHNHPRSPPAITHGRRIPAGEP